MNPLSNPGTKLPPVVVISLTDSLTRRAHITEQLKRAGVPFRFFNAERVSEYPAVYDVQTRLRTYGNHLTLGEVGCYDSHYRVWQELADSNNDIWCVLEDDVQLAPGFAARLSYTLDATTPWGIARLNEGGDAGRWPVGQLPDGAILHDHRKQPGGTQAYLIRRDAALTLLTYGKRMVHPVDDMLNRNWEHGIRMISTSPAVVSHCDEIVDTTITGRKKAQRSLPEKLRREFHMGRDSLSRHVDVWRRRFLESRRWNERT